MPEDIYKQDRFYLHLDSGDVIWMYHNPDAVSGDQFVTNVFDKELLDEALKARGIGPETDFEPSAVFDYVGCECRQYSSDVGMEAYDSDKEIFESEPYAIGMTNGTLEKLQLAFAAREFINDYCMEEFRQPADFRDLSRIGLAYTTTGDGKHEIQVYANLIEHRTEFFYDGSCIATQNADSLKNYVYNILPNLNFNELVDIPDWVIAEATHTGIYDPNLQYMEFEAWGDRHLACIEVSTYMFGGGLYMALQERCDDDFEPYADLTVNLEGFPCEKNRAFVDTNNFAQAEQLIWDFNLGEPTGRLGRSGYCTYPEYRFNMDEIRKYCVNPQDIPEAETKPKAKGAER